MTDQMLTWTAGVRARAAELAHEWDRRAIDWPLTAESIVVEVGGYVGRWALQIAERYGPRLYVYEPQGWAYRVCCEVLGDRAQVYNYGLGAADGHLPMRNYETDGCSFVDGDGPLCEVRDAATVLPKHIDLMMVNIEGYEYTLLPYLLDKGIFPDRLMVQWHPFTAEMQEIGASIVRRLARRRYRLLWDYGTTLMAWGKR